MAEKNDKKIFIRNNLIKDVTPKMTKEKHRKKNVILNFRVTPEQKELISKRIQLSGLLIQDYMTESCLHNKITVVGNVKTFDGMRKEMKRIDAHLRSVERADELELEVLESLRTILEILDGFYHREEEI